MASYICCYKDSYHLFSTYFLILSISLSLSLFPSLSFPLSLCFCLSLLLYSLYFSPPLTFFLSLSLPLTLFFSSISLSLSFFFSSYCETFPIGTLCYVLCWRYRSTIQLDGVSWTSDVSELHVKTMVAR